MTKLIAIVGATGTQGGSVLKTLYKSGDYKIRALARNPSSDTAHSLAVRYPGVEWVSADLNDTASLAKAFSGADVVFGITNFFQKDILAKVGSGDIDAEYNQGKAIVDAAIEAGAESLVWSSLDSAAKLSAGKLKNVLHLDGKHRVGEYLLSKSDQIQGFIIYLGFYMDNYINFSRVSPDDGKTVEFTLPINPETELPLVDTAEDTGPVVKYILAHPDEFRGVPVEVSGGYYKAKEMAEAFTKVTGRPSRILDMPYGALGSEELGEMFELFDTFGYYGGRTGFIERNKKMGHAFTTPAEFWQRKGWTGPSQA